MVCEETFWNPVSKGNHQYTPILVGECNIILRVKQVLVVDIEMKDITRDNKIPKRYIKKKNDKVSNIENSSKSYR